MYLLLGDTFKGLQSLKVWAATVLAKTTAAAAEESEEIIVMMAVSGIVVSDGGR